MKNLDPNEWDFRGLTDRNVEAATIYELTRSHEELRKQLTRRNPPAGVGRAIKKIQSTLPGPKAGALTRAEIEANELFAAVIGRTRGPTMYITVYFPEFPQPFLTLPINRIACPRPPTMILVGEGEPFEVYPLKEAPEEALAFTINHGHSEAMVIAAFKAWLAKAGGFYDKRKEKRIPTYATLKALAAYRLNQNGIKYRQAKLIVGGLKRDGGDKHDVLPWFEQHGGWTSAIKKTIRSLRELPSWMPARIDKRTSFDQLSFLSRTQESRRR